MHILFIGPGPHVKKIRFSLTVGNDFYIISFVIKPSYPIKLSFLPFQSEGG